jgi:hypothetical protein
VYVLFFQNACYSSFGCLGTSNDSFRSETIESGELNMTAKPAHELLQGLVRATEGPAGGLILLQETQPASDDAPNWIAKAGPLPTHALRRYDGARNELQRQHPRVDWNDVTERNGPWRRIALSTADLG